KDVHNAASRNNYLVSDQKDRRQQATTENLRKVTLCCYNPSFGGCLQPIMIWIRFHYIISGWCQYLVIFALSLSPALLCSNGLRQIYGHFPNLPFPVHPVVQPAHPHQHFF